MDALSLVRLILLVAVVSQLLFALVLFPVARQRFLEPLYRRAESVGQPVPPFVRNVLFSRIAAALMALPLAFLWWYLGTSSGSAFLRTLLERR